MPFSEECTVGVQRALPLVTLSLPFPTVFPLVIVPIHHLCRWNIFLKHGATSVKSFNEFVVCLLAKEPGRSQAVMRSWFWESDWRKASVAVEIVLFTPT